MAKLGYRSKYRQIKKIFPKIILSLPTSKRNKQLITRYHNALFGKTVIDDAGRKRHVPGLLSGRNQISTLTPQKAKAVRQNMTFHGKPVGYGLPKLGNYVITAPGKLKVTKNFITQQRGKVKYRIPIIEGADRITTEGRRKFFRDVAGKKPRKADIAIRIGSHILPGTYADRAAAQREFERLLELYEEKDIDMDIVFVEFQDQEGFEDEE